MHSLTRLFSFGKRATTNTTLRIISSKMAVLGYGLGAIVLGIIIKLLLTRYRRHLGAIPGPFVASFSNLWKLAAIYSEDMPGWNVSVHEKYGRVVRIGPSHVSFSSPEAFHVIHAAKQAFPKVY